MAESKISFLVSIDGQQYSISAPPSFLESLNSDDPRVRQKAYETVARDLGLSKTNKMAPDRITTESICQKDFQCQDQNVKDNNNNIQSPEQKIAKMWKKEEEEMMIHLRLAQDTLFCKSKNHEQLWDRIVDELNKNGVVVTKVQVINKWKALKKKYKEVIDANSKSGNERVDWKYFDTFHEVYGHKASTEPAFSMDSSGKNNKDVADKKTLQTGGRKRKVNSTDKVITVINESNEKLIGEIQSQHDAKMARLDRFLDIFQNAVQTKKD